MMNSYDATGVFPMFFGFEYHPGQAILIHPFALPAEGQHAAAVLVQQSAELINNGVRCWGLGLMVDGFSRVDRHDNGQHRLTMTDTDDSAITGLVVDIHGNSYHAVMPRDSTDNFGVHYMPSAGHRRTVLSADLTVMTLEASARALPELWRRHGPGAAHTERN